MLKFNKKKLNLKILDYSAVPQILEEIEEPSFLVNEVIQNISYENILEKIVMHNVENTKSNKPMLTKLNIEFPLQIASCGVNENISSSLKKIDVNV